MKDLLDKMYNTFVLSGPSILSQIDDYTLYCYYLGFNPEINATYISPLRPDDTRESFSLYYTSSKTLLYYDFGTGDSGDVFQLVAKLYGCSYTEALGKINEDFGLGFDNTLKKDLKIIKQIPVIKPHKQLNVTTKGFTKRGLEFWKQFYIPEYILNYYNVREVDWLHFDDDSFKVRKIAFDYRIGNYHKVYQPYNSDYKFINNYPRSYVEGYLQLKYKSDTLIITKSLKDVMSLYMIGYEAISPKSESTLIPDFILDRLESKYKYIYLLFDNDRQGILSSSKYKYKKLFMYSAKDVSDVIKALGIDRARKEIVEIIHNT